MRAMVFAAGKGTRLGALGTTLPKALVEAGGMTLLERVLRRLRAAGVDAAIVNTHHLAEAVEAWLDANRSRLGLRVEVSREESLLETGGGLKKAAWFFDDGEAFLVHNGDVVSDLDLAALRRAHDETGALATLAVRARPTQRYLLFDRDGRLRGREEVVTGKVEWAGAEAPAVERLAFDGVQILGPRFLERLREEGIFSLTRPYLRLAGLGERVLAFRGEGSYWADVGTPEKLERVRRDLADGVVRG